MTEEDRYAAAQAQIAEINTTAGINPNPMKSLLSAMLTAEMYARNERHHQRVVEARTYFVQTLQARLAALNFDAIL